jgi:LysM repeat protein
MTKKDSPQNVIDSYQRRQQFMPFLIGGLAVLLVVVGIIIVVLWLTGDASPQISLFASDTPTATNTATNTPVTPTSTLTPTATVTLTPTPSLTPTRSGPIEYIVQEGENCWDIANEFEVDLLVLLAINNFGGECPIQPGSSILIPAPDQQLPTETPIPSDLPRGTRIEYTIKLGDTLDLIASKFNSTIEDILLENNIAEEDINNIFAGQILTIRVNLVTPTPTIGATSTPVATSTLEPTVTPGSN